MRRNLPLTNSDVKNGPLPTIGTGLVKLVSAALGVTLLHTCSRQDGDEDLHHVGLRPRAGDLHGGRVERLGAEDAARRQGHVEHLVLDDVVVGEGDVVGRERLAVAPLEVRADLDGPDLAVGRQPAVLLGRVLRRQVEGRLVGDAEPEEEAVVDGPDLVVLVLPADERVQRVGLDGPADLEDDLVRRGRRRRLGGEGRRRKRQGGGQDDDEQDGEPERRPAMCLDHGLPPVDPR